MKLAPDILLQEYDEIDTCTEKLKDERKDLAVAAAEAKPTIITGYDKRLLARESILVAILVGRCCHRLIAMDGDE